MASHMARKHNRQEVFDYLTSEYQILTEIQKSLGMICLSYIASNDYYMRSRAEYWAVITLFRF